MEEVDREPGHTGADVLVTDSGGRAVRVSGPAAAPAGGADPAVLEALRTPSAGSVAGSWSTYWPVGTVVRWRYGDATDVLRVVRDDPRGLVAWLAPGSESLVPVPVDGHGLRDRPLADRFTVERELRVRRWRGPGILRVAPTGVPWSVWWFWDEVGAFEGHYLNLELEHRRPTSGQPETATRDLVLDLWVDADGVWLKDEDELEAAAATGWFSAEQGAAIRGLGERARHELVDPRAWPLDEAWESWRPPPGWAGPLVLPDTPEVAAARARGVM